MPDKKYKELMTRLDQKKKSGGNFRSYEKIRQDVKSSESKERVRTEAQAPQKEKKGAKKSSSKKNYFLLNLAKAAVPFIAAIFALILVIYLLTYKNATEISVNGEVVGHLKPATITAEDFLETLTAKIEQIEETKIKITDDITLVPVHGKRKLLMDDSDMLNMMADIVVYNVLAAEILVNGEGIGIARNQQEAQSIFDAIAAPYITNPENTTTEFIEDVKAIDYYVPETQIDTSDFIRSELTKTNSVSTEYEVVSGDSLSKIAAMHGITVNDIKDFNPELDVTSTLQPGQRLNIITEVPVVSVKTTETVSEIIEIPMTVEERPDSSLPAGQRRIVQQGKPGKKETVKVTIKINGIIVSESEASETILEPTEPQIVSVG